MDIKPIEKGKVQVKPFEWFSWLYIICLILVFFIALWQYYLNRSLWLDEAMLANNILNRNLLELLQPLDNFQSAPPLFLILLKLISYLSKEEWALRAVGLICFLVASILWAQFLKKELKNHLAIVLGICLFSMNFTMFRYAIELKQYAGDVLLTVILVPLTLNLIRNPMKIGEKIRFSLIAIIGILFSNIVLLLLIFPIGYFLYSDLKESKLPWFSLGMIMLVVSHYFIFAYKHPHIAYMTNYWENAGGFNIMSLTKLTSLFSNLFLFGKSSFWILGSLIFLGLFYLIQSGKIITGLVILLPIMIHITIAAFKKYPFDTRFCLYAIPLLVLLMCYGIQFLLNGLHIPLNSFLVIGLSTLISIFLLYKLFKNPFPIEVEELKEVITQIGANIKGTDNMYIYYGAVPAFEYYHHLGQIPKCDEIQKGKNYRFRPELYENEFSLKSDRIWFISSHVFGKEDSIIMHDIIYKGYQLKSICTAKGVKAALFSKAQ